MKFRKLDVGWKGNHEQILLWSLRQNEKQKQQGRERDKGLQSKLPVFSLECTLQY